MPFIVDTGAARTIIHGKDAVRYFAIPESELDSSTWTNAKPMLGLGGPVRCKEASAHFAFRHDSGDVEIISEKVLIGASESEVMPSLLGWDLLKYFRLDIHGGDQTIVLHRV